MFGFKLVMTRSTVFRNADDLGVNGAEIWFSIPEFTRFRRAARCHVLGIEIDHHWFARQIRKFHTAIPIGWQFEIRGLVTYIKRHVLSFVRSV